MRSKGVTYLDVQGEGTDYISPVKLRISEHKLDRKTHTSVLHFPERHPEVGHMGFENLPKVSHKNVPNQT